MVDYMWIIVQAIIVESPLQQSLGIEKNGTIEKKWILKI